MNKCYLMFGLAIAALTSCTQSEVVDIPQNSGIGFSTFVEKTTRGGITGNDIDAIHPLEKFYVFGYKTNYVSANENYTSFEDVFHQPENIENSLVPINNIGVTKNNNSWVYATSPILQSYWEKSKMYRFAAYANGQFSNTNDADLESDSGVKYDPVTDELSFPDYSVGDKDLIGAIFGDWETHTAMPSSTFLVKFRFRHMLAKLVFDFHLTTDLVNSDLKISNVKVLNTYNKGTGTMEFVSGDYNTIEWSDLLEQTGHTFSDEIKLTKDPQYLVCYVIPQEVKLTTPGPAEKDVKFSFTVTQYEKGTNRQIGTSHTHTIELNRGTAATSSWKAGFGYHYELQFGSENDATPINFGVDEIVPWANGFGTGSIILYSSNVAHTE